MKHPEKMYVICDEYGTPFDITTSEDRAKAIVANQPSLKVVLASEVEVIGVEKETDCADRD